MTREERADAVEDRAHAARLDAEDVERRAVLAELGREIDTLADLVAAARRLLGARS